MIEMAIIGPCYLILLMSVVDICLAVHSHTMLFRMAKEAVRAASSIPYLEPGSWRCNLDMNASPLPPTRGCTFSSTPNPNLCYVPPPAAASVTWTAQVFNVVAPQSQARLLVLVSQMIRFQFPELRIRATPVITTCTDYSDPLLTRVSARINATYNGFFFLWGNIGIRVRASGPYTT